MQAWRGPHNLFEHRGLVDFFSQSDVFSAKSVLGLLSIFDVRPRNVPTRNLTLIVMQGGVTGQKPPVTSVAFAQSHLQRKSRAVGDSTSRMSCDPLPVSGMNKLGRL